jgi:tetratricopeptide (TPR) repeat protein
MIGKRISILIIVLLPFLAAHSAYAGAKITKISGDVKVRRGVEEAWQNATIGVLLEDIDSILTGANSEVALVTDDGVNFKLGESSTLDISDLRKITRQEMFLYLMSKKVQKIEPGTGTTKLRIGNVSVVHGESKAKSDSTPVEHSNPNFWITEKNGAIALHDQQYYPNSIIKIHKILDKYNSIQDGGELYFYLGKSFEKIENTGQAIDAYQVAARLHEEQKSATQNSKPWLYEAQQAIEKLKAKN